MVKNQWCLDRRCKTVLPVKHVAVGSWVVWGKRERKRKGERWGKESRVK